MTVVALRQAERPASDVVRVLRQIADDIESGEYADWPVTTAVVVTGHTGPWRDGSDDPEISAARFAYRVHGAGPRSDPFTAKGLLAYAIADLSGADD